MLYVIEKLQYTDIEDKLLSRRKWVPVEIAGGNLKLAKERFANLMKAYEKKWDLPSAKSLFRLSHYRRLP